MKDDDVGENQNEESYYVQKELFLDFLIKNRLEQLEPKQLEFIFSDQKYFQISCPYQLTNK